MTCSRFLAGLPHGTGGRQVGAQSSIVGGKMQEEEEEGKAKQSKAKAMNEVKQRR